jgi:iron complex transport system substrate-binding protein
MQRLMLPVLLMLALLLGCAGADTSTTASSTPSGTAFPVVMTDDLGRTVEVASAPQRIVSLAPSNTEIVYDLGLGDKLVGVTDYCDYPPEAMEKEKVGGYSDINIEKVISLEPDLVLAEDIHKTDIIPALERAGITCYALIPHDLDEIMNSILVIGQLTGATEKAQDIVDDMQKRIDYITQKTAGLSDEQKLRVMYVSGTNP